MAFVKAFLGQHQLSQYEDKMPSNGFDTLEVLLAVTEKDLEDLGFLVGHRRELMIQIGKIKFEQENIKTITAARNLKRKRETLDEKVCVGIPCLPCN